MKKVFLMSFIFSVFYIFLGGINLSLANIKIGCVDMQTAIQMTTLGKQAKQQLEEAFQKKQQEINKAQEALKAKEKDLSSPKSRLLSDKALSKRRAKLQKEIQDFQLMVQSNTLQIQKQERELLDPIVKQIGEIIEDIAKKEKYTMILERSRQNVLWLSHEVDLTKTVAQVFEAKNKASNKKLEVKNKEK